MTEFFRGSEILRVAMRIEENGEAFYRQAAGKVKDAKIRDLLGGLADEEAEHRKIFADMSLRAEDYRPPESYPGEYSAYLSSYADDQVLTEENARKFVAEKVKSMGKIIDFALKLEVDSILYYLGVKSYVSPREEDTIGRIVEEEYRHYLKLTGIKKEVMTPRKGGEHEK